MNQMEIRRRQAVMLTYMPAILYILWLTGRIGDNGAGYLTAALQCWMLFMVPLLLFLPDAEEKLIRSRMARGQYKNADRIWKGALLYAAAAGAVGSLLLFLLSEVCMKNVLFVPYGVLPLKMIAPALLFTAFSAAVKGYFQGMGTGMPTVSAEVVTMIIVGISAILICVNMEHYGEKVAALLRNEDFTALYGSAGIALGITAGCLFGMGFLWFLYLSAGSKIQRRGKDSTRITESIPRAFGLILTAMRPYLPAGFLLQVPAAAGVLFFQREQSDIYGSIDAYGAYGGKCVPWMLLFVLPAAAGCVSLAGKTVTYIKREEFRQGRDCIQAAVTWSVMAGAFSAAVFAAIGPSLILIFSPQDAGPAGELLRACAATVFFLPPVILFAYVLRKNGREKELLLGLLAGCAAFIIVTVLCLKITAGDIRSLVYGNTAWSISLLAVCAFFSLRILRFRADWLRCILFPLLSAAASGVIMFMLGRLLIPLLGASVGSLICLAAGYLIHMILLLFLKCLREQELEYIPWGRMLEAIGNLFRLL